MRFAHLADVHLGSWKEPKLRDLSERSFSEAIGRCISSDVDFVLLAGDLFNTSIPPIDSLKLAVSELKKLKDNHIPVYTIAGSHDFSPSGKTMLDVLEEAGLIVNVCRGEVVDDRLRLHFTTDKKTGAKITGIIGKKGMLDRAYYESLITDNLEQEQGFRIFMFHTAISELKPEDMEKMDSAPLSLLPRGFDYYAGGHVHIVKETSIEDYNNIVYPGPTFPNSFAEIEKLHHGGFYIYDDGKLAYEKLDLCDVVLIDQDCNHKSPDTITGELVEQVAKNKVADTLVLLRLHGIIETGKTSEINLKRISELLEEKGAYFVMRNTNKLASRDFEEIHVKADTAEEQESLVVAEHLGQVCSLKLSEKEESDLAIALMRVLDLEKDDGEKQADFETRVISAASKAFERI
jgi:exonuclease SbcD